MTRSNGALCSIVSQNQKAQIVNVRYRKIPNPDRPEGYSLTPLLQVFLKNGSNMYPFLALVDSGAADCIFPASVGELLGIDVSSGHPRSYFGLAGQEAQGFLHRIQMQVAGFDHWVEVEAGFVDSDIVPLLGQTGFFDHYQIVFERFRRQFQINSKVNALVRNRRGLGRGR